MAWACAPLTGAAVSTDEVVALPTGFDGGVGLPANNAIALSTLSVGSVLLEKSVLQSFPMTGWFYPGLPGPAAE